MVFSLGIFAFYHHSFSVPGVYSGIQLLGVLHLTELIAAMKMTAYDQHVRISTRSQHKTPARTVPA